MKPLDHQRRAPGHGQPYPFERARVIDLAKLEIDRLMKGPVATYRPSDLKRVGNR